MADFIIKPASGDTLKLQDEGGDDAISISTTGATTFAEVATFSSGVLGNLGNGFMHIETLTASGTPTEMHIEDCFTSTYTNYLLQVSDYLPSTDGQDTKINFSTGGTPNTGSYYWYTWAGVKTSDGTDHRLNAKDVAFVYMNPNCANDGAGCSGTWFIHQPQTTAGYAMGHGVTGVDHNGGYFVGGAHHFGWRGNTEFNGIKLSVGTGTIGNGAKMTVYGMKES